MFGKKLCVLEVKKTVIEAVVPFYVTNLFLLKDLPRLEVVD
jgi:hypothetical protein